MSIRLTVQFQSQPGKGDEFAELAQAAAVQVRADDKGCEAYNLFRSLDDDTKFVLIEAWATAEDLTAHGSSPAMATMQKIGPLLSGRPTMNRYED